MIAVFCLAVELLLIVAMVFPSLAETGSSWIAIV